jgi:16S rRNA (adenine1518-N6/adenine1519-N6)-dimethyltransferase
MSDKVVPNKNLGQHWLTDEYTLNKIADTADLVEKDIVLEVGPGLGTLTEVLSKSVKKVIAVDIDLNLIYDLKMKFINSNVDILNEDILKYDLTKLSKNYKIVANIPYYLTSHFIQVISESSNPPASVTLLIQKEVAERLAAKPGKMSLLSVTSQYYWNVEIGEIVKSNLFIPPPKVDSQIVYLKRKDKLPLNKEETKLYFRIVKAGFSQKRKTLLNSLSAGLNRSRGEVSELLFKINIDPNRRAQTLSLEEWIKIYNHIKA